MFGSKTEIVVAKFLVGFLTPELQTPVEVDYLTENVEYNGNKLLLESKLMAIANKIPEVYKTRYNRKVVIVQLIGINGKLTV